jgi:hypothetical protein
MADPLIELAAQLESMQSLLRASLTDSAEVAELKTKMAFIYGNGKPGVIQELKDSDARLNQAMWYMKGALWVLVALTTLVLTPLAIFLAEQWLMAHR